MKKKKMHLLQYMMPPVTHHSSATWKHPRNMTMTNAFQWNRPEIWQEVAQIAERGKLDAVFFADTEGIYSEYENSYKSAVRYASQVPCYEPSVLMAFMGAVTKHIGLTMTFSVAGYPPYILARKLATLDHLSRGRVGWNVVTAFHKNASENLGLSVEQYHLSHDQRYDRLEEYMEVCYKLWDSWEPDAIVMDAENNIFADPEKVHPINHEGKWFKCKGPLNIDRSPQGRPVILQAGQSSRGIQFAAKHAELIFTLQPDREAMKVYYNRLKEEAVKAGRDPDDVRVCFGLQVFVGETEEIARAKAALHNSLVPAEAGVTILSGHLGYDLSKHGLDELIADLKVPGIQGMIDAYKHSSSKNITIREAGMLHGRGVMTPQLVGSPEQVADWMEETMKEVGGDGFLLSPAYLPGSLEEFVELVVPILQKRGLARTEYVENGTLRDNLKALNA
ncbi:N5,N10-methylene tetrahydromethanopterin reductase [Aeribacillus pallidus]|nr:N5,N10-methylene tetrahydromethanopterin reductase [Aeribacillus pallidus]